MNQQLLLILFGTWRIPRFVIRTVGGKAKITDANTPGTIPIPKKATAGIKYTKPGIVCMKSSIGLITFSATVDLDIRMPRGIPNMIEIILEKSTSVVVSIRCVHKP